MDNEKKGIKVESKPITEVQSESIYPASRYGPLVSRIPVIISQSKVHINIESEIYLDHSVVDIRNCSRDVCITKCNLLDLGNRRQGKIYINGYISENIEYAANLTENNNLISTDIFYKIIKIPFEFSTKIDYTARPLFVTSNKFISVGLPESVYKISTSCLSNEKLFCELEEAAIHESEAICKKTHMKDDTNHNTFDTIIEYLTVSIIFTLLQWQQISIPRPLPYNTQ